jgi:uncharacterized protein (UPF0297 family)
MEETRKFQAVDSRTVEMKAALLRVYDALREKDYHPIDQMVGYLLSEDPTYITSHKGARATMCKIDRDELMQSLLKEYLNNT